MRQRDRIGYLVSQYPATSHTFIRREVEALRRRGAEIETFSVRRPGPDELTTDRDRISAETTAYLLPAKPLRLAGAILQAALTSPAAFLRTFALALKHRVPGARALLWSLFHFAEAMMLARLLKQKDISRLHNHFANSGATVGLLASNFLTMPWSLTLHGISETDYPAGLLLAQKIESAEFVACVSWFGRAQAMRLVSPDQWSKFIIVRCGVDLSLIARRPDTKRVSDLPTEIICVGRLSDEKGQAGLLEAVSTLLSEGHEVRLSLVGDGPNRAMLETSAASLGISEKVRFLGRLDESATLDAIARSDVLVMSSFMEGLPIVLMEAMAVGVPVVAPMVAGVPELVRPGIDGLLYPPGNWRALSQTMAEVVAHPDASSRRTKAGRERVAAEFDIDLAIRPLMMRFLGDD